jgi:hypothetical protein
MTCIEMRDDIAARFNFTSTDTLDRVGRGVNLIYKASRAALAWRRAAAST